MKAATPRLTYYFLIAYGALSICCVILQRCAIDFAELPVDRREFWTAAPLVSFPLATAITRSMSSPRTAMVASFAMHSAKSFIFAVLPAGFTVAAEY
ncbi:hypothetical protein [Bradyrhizobium retamae]|uniref:hypothetical protein n=1 Tax=Bradyrhizobium retamae TaxID=1300035 RepID=UPI0012E3E398|nr:hypothetical protein [Bradyrhizobium retamae]